MFNCPVCDTVNFTRNNIVDGPVMAHCSACQHIWQDPPEVSAIYDKKYVDERYEKYSTVEAMNHLRLGHLMGHVGDGRILDVGYGNGGFLKLAAKAGFETFGNDVHAADFGITEHPLISPETYAAVTFFDSLEHFSDLEPVRNLVERADVVIVSMPLPPSTFPENREWRHYRPGEHLHYFCPMSLSRFMHATHACVGVSHMEDVIRKPQDGLKHNIFTSVFERVC